MKLTVLLVVVAALALTNAEPDKAEALMAVEKFANTFNNNELYARIIGTPHITFLDDQTAILSSILLAPTSCSKEEAEEFENNLEKMNEACPAPAADTQMIMSCVSFVVWEKDQASVDVDMSDCHLEVTEE